MRRNTKLLQRQRSAAVKTKKRSAAFLLVLGLFVGCGVNNAPPVPAIIEGDSMAPTICGEHLLATCIECQCEFKAQQVVGADFKLTCPNCGFDAVEVSEATVVGAAKVELKPFARFPRRWDVVGFELPEESESETGIKRIVGLPGDTIDIRDGDLYCNDRILRKAWAQQQEVRVPVFDSKFNAIAPFDNASRFRIPGAPSGQSGWEVRGSELRFSSSASKIEWLEYVQWRNFPRSGNRADKRNEEFPIEDSYGFNQQTVRQLNATRDLMLALDVEFENGSTILLQFRRGDSEFVFSVSKSEKSFAVSWQGATDRKPLVYKSSLAEELPRGLIEFSSFDRAVMLRVNGTPVFELREDESESLVDREPKTAADVFRIGGGRGTFKVSRFQLWRDTHYLTAPAGFQMPANLKLTAGSDEYILLGDNSPVSLDSRTWKKPRISRSELIGRVVLPLDEE